MGLYLFQGELGNGLNAPTQKTMDIRIEGLTKTFTSKDNVETIAVNNLSFTIPDGHLVGLLGPSGCGKSTTLFLLAGLHEPTSGKIFFGDEDVTALPPEKRGIGLVFQNYALYPHMSVYDNIAFPLNNSKSFKQEHPNAKERKQAIDKIVQETAKIVAIEELLKRKPGQLSGGQQQRVAIARAIAKQPKVLLLDEPLSNLDARLRMQTREEIRRIQKETGITTIFVTHDQEEAMSITDEIVVMKKGVIQQMGNPQETYMNPNNAFVAMFLGNPPINMFKATVKNGFIQINGENAIKTELADGTELQVGLRPESFRIITQDIEEAKNNFDIDIFFKATIGRDFLVRFNLNDTEAKALIESDNVVNVGDKVRVHVKSNGIHIFDTEGNRILQW